MSQEIRRKGREIWIFDDAEAYGSDRQYRLNRFAIRFTNLEKN